jgi:hypothetical protein
MRSPINLLVSHELVLAIRHARVNIHDQNALSERLAPVQSLRQLVFFTTGVDVVGGDGLGYTGKDGMKGGGPGCVVSWGEGEGQLQEHTVRCPSACS